MEHLPFLNAQRTPLRLSVNANDRPLIVPLWFYYDAKAFWCASHKDSLVIAAIGAGVRCGFDVSTNDMPYRGVRGRGIVRCHPEAGARVLERLLDRYLPDRDNKLARWLLSRAADEVAIEVTPVKLSSWDYSERMRGLTR